MNLLRSARVGGAGGSTAFLKVYVVGGVVVLLAGFILYSQWILHRLEDRNSALVQPFATLMTYVPGIRDHQASELLREAIKGVVDEGLLTFVITDEKGVPVFAQGVDPVLEAKLDNPADGAVTPTDIARLDAYIDDMRASGRDGIAVAYTTLDRRIIGRIHFGDVDPEHLAEMPLVLSDIQDRPVAWRIYGQWQTALTHPGEVNRATALIRDAARRGRVEDLQVDPPTTQGTFYYKIDSNPALKWMPVVQILLVGGFIVGGVILYRRIQADEQAAIWAGLAKESAHQLGTPITSLMGWVDLARETSTGAVGPPDGLDLYGEMDNDLRRLQRIVARFSQVGLAPERAPVAINEIAADAASYFRARLPSRSRGITLTEEYADIPTVNANADLMQWVLENLIRNAIDAIESHGVAEGFVALSTRYDVAANCVTIAVKDNGGGIAPAVRRRLFAPGVTTKPHGWGVGLTLVKRIVEVYHFGRVRLADTDHQGSTFEVRLPAADSPTGRPTT
jgi:signal transduction histidine kinase